jgi:hypothetical protein
LRNFKNTKIITDALAVTSGFSWWCLHSNSGSPKTTTFLAVELHSSQILRKEETIQFMASCTFKFINIDSFAFEGKYKKHRVTSTFVFHDRR